MVVTTRLLGLLLFAPLAFSSTPAVAQHSENDNPYHYDLRIALFPVAFEAALSQSHFGSSARAELDLSRRVCVQLFLKGGWLNVAGEQQPTSFGLRAGISWNLRDIEDITALAGTVYPEDTPAVGGRGPATDRELEVPMSSKLSGPRLRLPDADRTARAPIRSVQSIRVGYDLARAVERARPDAVDGHARHLINTLQAAYLGYGWGSHWNLSAATTGTPEAGWRRFYVDAVLTLPALVKTRSLGSAAGGDADFFPLGARLGMEGAIGALLRSVPGVGFGYSLELGALPGRSGFEGYLFLGLGLALDLPTRSRSI